MLCYHIPYQLVADDLRTDVRILVAAKEVYDLKIECNAPRQTTSEITPLDVAITTRDQDDLARSLFVERLADAVVDPATKKATGVVIGIAGEWGSGKSSILNLVEENLRTRHQDAIVFRFNPWLISDAKDLITEFLNEFLALIRRRVQDKILFKEIKNRLNDYAEIVAVIGDAQLPGLGRILRYFQTRFLNRSKTAQQAREELISALDKMNKPVVIVIDELDRVNDNEIRTLAQIVKSVADFPNVSYLLAYDAKRVAEALGNNDEGRGQSYLEKIVQLQLPVPVLFQDEIKWFLCQTLERFSPPLILPSGWQNNERFLKLIDCLNACNIDAPRALKRIVGHFAIISRMVGREVGWVDLLGYSVLLAIAPRSVSYMRMNPDQFVHDSQEYSLFFNKSKNYAEWVQEIKLQLPELRSNPGLWELFILLFPALGDRTLTIDVLPPPDSIAHRRMLLTVLRLGALPDAYLEEEFASFVAMGEEDRIRELRCIVEQGRWYQFSEKLVRWLLSQQA